MSEIELVGPFRETFHEVVYRGKIVPNLRAHEVAPGRWELRLDGRWSTVAMSKEEVLDRIPMIADAQAMGAGYACHGAEEKFNPFGVSMVGVKVDRKPDDGAS